MTGFKRTISAPRILTPQLQKMRAFAAENPDAFIQSWLKVISKTAGIVPFNYTWTQQKIASIIKEEEEAGKPLRLYILKSRRIGSSTMMSYRFFTKVWARDNVNALILAQYEEVSEELVQRLKFAYSSLPTALKLHLSQDNSYGIQYADTRAKLTIASARNIGVARGPTKQLLLLTEAAYYKNTRDVIVEFLEPIAYEFGTEAIIETTGKGFGSQAHQLWEESRKGKTAFRAVFLAWQDDPASTWTFESDLDRDLKLAEAFDYEPRLKDRMRLYKLTPGNIFWIYRILKNVLLGDYQKMLIDYPCDEHEPWTSSELSYFGTENVNSLRPIANEFPFQYRGFSPDMPLDENIADIDSFESLQILDKVDENASRPFFKVWAYPRRNSEYVISGDSAEGLESGDFSSSFVIDQNTFEMMCEFHGKCRPDEHGYIIAMLGNIYNDALAAPEINPPGNVTFMTLQSCYNNIYRYKHPYMDNINTSKNATRHLAWQTNSTSRPTMLALAKRLVEDISHDRLRMPGILKSRELLNEMSTFAPNDDGKPEAINGACDDRVIAWAIAIEVSRQEIHGTEKDILNLYRTQGEDKPLPAMDPKLMQHDPKDVIRQFQHMWDKDGPRLWRQEDGLYGN